MTYNKLSNWDERGIYEALVTGKKVLIVDLRDEKIYCFETVSYLDAKRVIKDESGRYAIFEVYEKVENE